MPKDPVIVRDLPEIPCRPQGEVFVSCPVFADGVHQRHECRQQLRGEEFHVGH